MMSSSRGLHGYGKSWLVLLLLAQIFWLTLQQQLEGRNTTVPTSQADPKINITLKPLTPIAGADITLIPGGYAEDIGICFWLRGGKEEEHRIFTYFPAPHFNQEVGPAYTGREMAGKGCSLYIRNLTTEDSGNYTIFKNKLRGSDEHQEGNIYLVVLSADNARAENNLPIQRSGRISPNVTIGIVLGSIFGISLLGGLLYFRLFYLLQVPSREQRLRNMHNLQPKWSGKDQGSRT